MVPLPKVDQQSELFLMFSKPGRDLPGLIEAVEALIALLQGLDGVLLGREVGKEGLKLVLSAVAQLIVESGDNTLIHIGLCCEHGSQGIGGTEEAS